MFVLLGILQKLISAAKKSGIHFVYAISPGLDITFSSPEENQLLKEKLDQVKDFGCPSFALLFDDIDSNLDEEDEKEFKTPEAAQSKVTNDLFQHLQPTDVFMFCPTGLSLLNSSRKCVL